MIAGETSNKLRELGAVLGAPDRDAQLLKAIADSDLLVRRRAIALGARFLEPAELLNLLRDGAHATRRGAALSALRRQVPYCFDALKAAFDDPDPDVVIACMEVLSEGGDRTARPLFERMSEHTDPNLAAAAVEALGRLGDKSAVPVVMRALGRGPWQRMAAIASLGELQDRRATSILVTALDDADECDLATAALGRLGDPTAIVPLLAFAERTRRKSSFQKVVLALAQLVEGESVLGADVGNALRRLCSGARYADLEQLLATGEQQHARAAARVLLAANALGQGLERILLRSASAPEDWADLLSVVRPRVEQELQNLLNHTQPEVRIQALLVANRAPLALRAVMRCAEQGDARARVAACGLLGRAGSAQATGVLIARLSGDAEPEREAALGALIALGAGAHPILLTALETEQRPEVRALLLRALAGAARVDAGPLAERIVSWANSERGAVRRAALAVCAAMASVDARRALEAALDDSDSATGADAANLLVRSGHVQPVLQRLEREHASRFAWISTLGRPGGLLSVQPLIRLYTTAQPHERVAIVTALSRIGSSEANRFLLGKLRDPEGAIRRVAVESVCTGSERLELSALEELARDGEWAIRKNAVLGLAKHEPARGRALLVELARDPDDMVSEAARTALGCVLRRPS
jgi:HEAT repeat protein